ncbi:MAG: hypothetical protein NVS3B24_23540 [Candidatus Dormibacteria bacterium]
MTDVQGAHDDSAQTPRTPGGPTELRPADIFATRGGWIIDTAAMPGPLGTIERISRFATAAIIIVVLLGMAALALRSQRNATGLGIAASLVGAAVLVAGSTWWWLRRAGRLRRRAEQGDPSLEVVRLPGGLGAIPVTHVGKERGPYSAGATTVGGFLFGSICVVFGAFTTLLWFRTGNGYWLAAFGFTILLTGLWMLAQSTLQAMGRDAASRAAGNPLYSAWYEWALKQNPTPAWARRMAAAAVAAESRGANQQQAVAAALAVPGRATWSAPLAGVGLFVFSMIAMANWRAGAVLAVPVAAVLLTVTLVRRRKTFR